MTIFDGRAIASDIRAELKEQIEALHLKPGLGIIMAGNDAASELYVRNKMRDAAEVGVRTELVKLSAEASKDALLQAVRRFNADAKIHGIIVQVPLPRPEEADEIIAAIDPKKDVDGFHPATLDALRRGERERIPVMGRVILDLLSAEPTNGKRAVVVAKNAAFIEGLTLLLADLGVDTTSIAPDRSDPGEVTREADILIAAGNQPALITRDMVKPGTVVIDIGITKNTEGKTVGCVDFDGVSEIASAITPVPGGVGPMTIAYLLWNTVLASEDHRAA